MIRILHVVTTLDRGGIETMLMNYYRNIDRSKVQFDFLKHVDYPCDYESEAVEMGSRVYTLPKLNPFSWNYRNRLNTFFQEHPEYKIVHSHLDCMSAVPLLYAKKNGVKFRIAHAHNTNQEHNLKYFLKMHYKKRIPDEANILFACGQDAGKWMYGSKTFKVLHNAIDGSHFTFNEAGRIDTRKEWGIEDCFVIGHVGRFFEQKNHKKLIDIFAEITKLHKNSRLLLVGVGPLEKEIREYVACKKLNEKVIFCGLSREVNKMLWAMDVFVLPSLYEGLPVTLIEAQASGIRCVVSDTITKETRISDNIQYIGLEESDRHWADQILSFGNTYDRLNMELEIKSNKYDIKGNSAELQKYYMGLVGDNT